jgi:hypothetical protein
MTLSKLFLAATLVAASSFAAADESSSSLIAGYNAKSLITGVS